MLMFTLQLAVAGIATGSVYALIALGIVLIYKCSGVVNFAQGAFVMLGAYLTYGFVKLGLPPYVALLGSMIVMAGCGVASERLVLRPMMKAPLVAVMTVTLGMLILVKAVCLAVWGPDQIAFPRLFPDGALDIFGIFITYNYLAAFVLSIAVSLGFLAFYQLTPIGLMQRCTADNPRAALAIGIHTSNQISLAWSMSAALAGIGGALLASLNGLSLGLADIGLVAFPVIVLGGLTSLTGALVAGLLLGVLQALTDGLLTPVAEQFLRTYTSIYSAGALQQVVPYALLVVVLLVRPEGIFGQRGTERL
ncbi:branched-chain amino acid ABC transporter permease [Bradyrhizobium sp. SSBR45G]|uniref:branched-chain amino acid ABC transporter permease n=1 Tax=unclassified Bradyrhizobium TaxID=2631580 RepID=UPI002342BCBB|nr:MULTISPECIES: branched-chain amino acid ABC transporter permease [unclassified Bradyrhizobium]GLH79787.1 branched-chain amino acid ABC transporter permease [Bradyrhizobium sp. SSBR45G]GLH87094.1 branched-chain amino acid ABC transporter permease [Bradyrhizobium sp. SSBR45R]